LRRNNMRIAARSFVIFMNQVIASVVPLVMAVILTRMISKSELGMFRQVTMVYLLISSLLSLSISTSMYYFLPRAPVEEHRSILLQGTALLLLMACVATLLMFFGAQFLATYVAKDVRLLGPLRAYSFFALGDMFSKIVSPALISKERVILSGIFEFSRSALKVVAVVVAFAIGLSLEKVMYVAVGASAVSAVIGVVFLLLVTVRSRILFSFSLLLEQLRYVVPIAAAGIAGLVSKQLDKWVIMLFYTSSQYAVYSIGAMQLPVVSFVSISVTDAIMPNIVRMGKEGRIKDALKLWHDGIRKCALIIFPAYVFCFVASRDLIVFLFSKNYVESVGPFVVYLTLLPIQVAFYGTILRATGNTRPILFAAISGLLVNLVVSLGLVTLLKGTYIAFLGPAIGTVFSAIVINLYQLVHVAKTTGTSFGTVFPWTELAAHMLLSVVCGLLVLGFFLFLPLHVFWKLLIGFLLYSGLYIWALFGLKILRQDEKDLLFMPFRLARCKISFWRKKL